MRPLPTLLWLFFVLSFVELNAQSIVDPCFASIKNPGRFDTTPDIQNVCGCPDDFIASDLMEWDGSVWDGALNPKIDTRPPEGCNIRAFWMGYQFWTSGGEGFAMRLDKPLESGRQYAYTFTYTKADEQFSEAGFDFAPNVYTDSTNPALAKAIFVGTLPSTVGWTTQTISFKAGPLQAGHSWLILHTLRSSGIVLSNCTSGNIIEKISIAVDTSSICEGDELKLKAMGNKMLSFQWNTGAKGESISVLQSGTYSVKMTNEHCEISDSITVFFEDCSPKVVMPNVFTPNGDPKNDIFIPMSFDKKYFISGRLVVYNRWGQEVFEGDVLKGWNGSTENGQASAGVYYYIVTTTDIRKRPQITKGNVTVLK